MMRYQKLIMLMACAVVATTSVRAADTADSQVSSSKPQILPEMMVGRPTLERLLPRVAPADSAADSSAAVPAGNPHILLLESAPLPALPPSTRPAVANSGGGLATADYFQHSVFSTVGEVVDFDTTTLPSFDANILSLSVPSRLIQPFWSVARQVETPRDDSARLGFGTGLRWNLGPRANLATQTLIFPADRGELDRNSPAATLTDLQFITRLEIKF